VVLFFRKGEREGGGEDREYPHLILTCPYKIYSYVQTVHGLQVFTIDSKGVPLS
jgi:hypothetical protein